MVRVVLLGMGLLLTAGCGPQPAPYPAREAPPGFLSDPANRAAGAALFADKCASCHGSPDEGRSPRTDFFRPAAPDFSENRYREADPAYLFWRISEGKTVEPFLSRGSVMPAWGRHLDERQIWQLVAYLQVRAAPQR